MIKKINHIALVVPKLEEGVGFWADALGMTLNQVEEVPSQEVRVGFFDVGESHLELVEPTTDDSGIAKYLAKRGPGIHHIALEVDNIEVVLAQLKEKNVPLINEEPVLAAGGNRAAFIHPKGTGGVLVELYEVETERGESDDAHVEGH